MKKIAVLAVLLVFSIVFTSCASATQKNESDTILVAAAASLEKCFQDKLIPMFYNKFPYIGVDGVYDSSGKLQTQIEEGLEADVFMSASEKNMSALVESGKISSDSVMFILENHLVLIAPASSDIEAGSFERITEARAIAVGDPESVPAGQYAKEVLENLGIWDSIADRLSLATNVTEVLTWVSEGSADAGIVYATDAANSANVKVLAEAPEGSLKAKILYPVGIASKSEKKESAKLFAEFLASDDALAVFEEYGFAAVRQ